MGGILSRKDDNSGPVPIYEAVARGLFYASLQVSLGFVALNSKLSLVDSRDDQQYFDEAANFLKIYMIAALVWTISSMLLTFAEYGWCGAFFDLVSNIALTTWVIYSYHTSLKKTSQKLGLHLEEIPRTTYIIVGSIALILLVVTTYYFIKSRRNVIKNTRSR